MPAAKCPAWDRPGRAPSTFFSSFSHAQWKKPAWQACHASFPRPSCHLKGPRASSGARLPEARGRCRERGFPPPTYVFTWEDLRRKKGECGLQPRHTRSSCPSAVCPWASFSDLNSQQSWQVTVLLTVSASESLPSQEGSPCPPLPHLDGPCSLHGLSARGSSQGSALPPLDS